MFNKLKIKNKVFIANWYKNCLHKCPYRRNPSLSNVLPDKSWRRAKNWTIEASEADSIEPKFWRKRLLSKKALYFPVAIVRYHAQKSDPNIVKSHTEVPIWVFFLLCVFDKVILDQKPTVQSHDFRFYEFWVSPKKYVLPVVFFNWSIMMGICINFKRSDH